MAEIAFVITALHANVLLAFIYWPRIRFAWERSQDALQDVPPSETFRQFYDEE